MVTYSYDAAGNVTWDGAHGYVYDAENRIVGVDGGATAQYGYDHLNRRIRKATGAGTVHYIWEGWQIIAEHNGTSGAALVDYIYAGRKMIAKEQAGLSTKYLINDRLSVRMVITGGTVISGSQGHLPFGDELGTSGEQEKRHFTTYERDSETGTDFAMNRQYSHNVGRFMRVDPYSGSARYEAPQSWNRYSYVKNEPVDQTDPLGLDDGNPEYCAPWRQSCDHLGSTGSGFSFNAFIDPALTIRAKVAAGRGHPLLRNRGGVRLVISMRSSRGLSLPATTCVSHLAIRPLERRIILCMRGSTRLRSAGA